MSETNTYDVFEVEGEGNYFFGPNEFANDPRYPYSKITLWKFHNDNYCLSLLQLEKKILMAYGNSEIMEQYLIDRKVKIKEMNVLAVEKDGWKIRLEDGYFLALEHQWTYAYYLSKNYKDAFFSFFDGCDLNTEGPNLAPNLVVNKKVTHVFSIIADKSGTLPKKLDQYLLGSQIASDEETSSGLSSLIILIFVAFIIGMIYLGWNS